MAQPGTSPDATPPAPAASTEAARAPLAERHLQPSRPAAPAWRGWRAWPAPAAWAVAWGLMLALDGHVDLANQALVLILGSAVAAIWWGPATSAVAIALAVLGFNFAFVPPRGTLAVDLHHHGLLLLAMMAVSGIITALVARQRRLAAEADQHARRSDELRRFGDALREVEDPLAGAAPLREMLGRLSGHGTALLVTGTDAPTGANAVAEPSAEGTDVGVGLSPTEHWFGEPGPVEQEGLRLCAREGRGLGPGSGRHEEQAAWYLPLRGLQRTHGAALVHVDAAEPPGAPDRAHAQALCDQLGTALERAAAERAASQARQQAQWQAMRNTLLSAVAHDHRTPLATIVSAAGALHDQADRLDEAQRRRLAATVIDEATQLARITDNTLQLARLDAARSGGAPLDITREWESLEELIGSVLRRLRQRDPAQRLRARVEPGLPLVRCDAVLICQLIDNLVDNALKYAGDGGPVEVTARRAGDRVQVAVRDRGPGVPAELAPRLFEAFSRGPAQGGPAGAVRGTGVGLALCRAIARVHGGELVLRARRGGGTTFELSLPVEPAPEAPADEPPGEGAA